MVPTGERLGAPAYLNSYLQLILGMEETLKGSDVGLCVKRGKCAEEVHRDVEIYWFSLKKKKKASCDSKTIVNPLQLKALKLWASFGREEGSPRELKRQGC